MVAQINCVACSLAPEITTTEITFHKFPDVENTALEAAWSKVLSINIEKSIDGNLKDIFICSRHFISDDFEFVDGKLILKGGAVPSIFPPRQLKTTAETLASSAKLWQDVPTTHGANFAFTSTINQLTIARNHVATLTTSTDTPTILTSSFSEYIPTISDINAFERINGKLSDDAKKALKDSRITVRAYKKRNILLMRKNKTLTKLVAKMRDDNLLTNDYIQSLQVKLGIRSIFQ